MIYSLGIDFGTSGARAIVIDSQKEIVYTINSAFDNSVTSNLATVWQETLYWLLENIPTHIRQKINAIAINGTSSTVLLCDATGKPLDDPILYNDARGKIVLDQIRNIAPPHHVVISATSSLAKLLWWQQQPIFTEAVYLLHQADWLSFLLHGKLGISDYHNALKLGYDVEKLEYPSWLQNLDCSKLFPQVFPPGTPIGNITHQIGDRFSLQKNCTVYTGTTDSIAAFLASGATQPGEAVTSLGSTLVLKLLSSHPVTDSRYGIYSHRLGNLWLTGGASNTGGAVLRHFFTDAQLVSLSSQIDPTVTSNLEYYPLLHKGDRFPINDPNLPPQLEPRPDNPVTFLHGLLESMARIEALGYEKLQELGANKLMRVYTAGGGSKNPIWEQIRQRCLGVPVIKSQYTEAAYGTALLTSLEAFKG
ncbi:MAG: FGGY-family carbohydrate kinase [Xenococcaceae cyanobacterium MO_207.B15]|nr:FGGY-family carbohydrate kinase [Xenococcaceae cyanobacterium MO_207.B15]